MLDSMEAAYRLIGVGMSLSLLRQKDPSPQNMTFRARGWGYNMTAPVVCAGLGKTKQASAAMPA
jgi:hypothetical protein